MSNEEKPAEAPAPEGTEAPKKKKKLPGKKLVLFIVLPLLLLGGGGAGAYFMGLLDPLLGKTAKLDEHGKPIEGEHGTAEAEAKPAEEEPVDEHDITFLDLPPQMIALNTSGKTPIYLKISVALELAKHEDEEPVTKVLPRISDQFQTYLRELRPEDLKGSSGIYRLREELLARVNAASAPVKVRGVLFKEMIMQ